MAREFEVRKGTHIGRGHLIDFINRQDAHQLFDGQINDQRVIIGIICDGCSGEEGQKKNMSSEVGATLGSTFLIRETIALLKRNISTTYIPIVLYPNLIRFLKNTLDQYSFVDPIDKVTFIEHHLLFTVIGFVLTPENTVTFIAGDGTLVINNEARFIDSDNKPMYPAYHLVDRSLLQESSSRLPNGFEVNFYKTDEIKNLAIGSDAWKGEPELIDQIWGFKNPSGLQRRLNVWSNKEKRFKDDVTIITVEVFETENQEEEDGRSEEHTSELQSLAYLVCRLLLEKKKKKKKKINTKKKKKKMTIKQNNKNNNITNNTR